MTEIMWGATTRFHDWSDRRYPTALIDRAADADALGSATWVIARDDDVRERVNLEPPGLGAKILDRVSKRKRTYFLRAGGAGWSVSFLVPQWAKATNRVNGISVAVLLFDRPQLEDDTGSDRLWRHFREAHSPDDTEHAVIHPWDRWEVLRVTQYSPAVTYAPMFAGVAWANFIGPGHVEQFDRTALTEIKAEWDDRGLYLRDPAPLKDATSPEVEERLFRLTEAFRRARKA